MFCLNGCDMSVKIRILLIQFVVFLTITSPVFSVGPNDEDSTSTVQTRPQPISLQKDQRIVPHSDGVPQDFEGFRLLFKGEEDSTSVRLTTHSSLRQYTLREKMRYLIWGQKSFQSTLSGTMTSHGVMTNGHGFVEEVPCAYNWILENFNSKYRFYRTLEPVSVEQGLTTEQFKPDDQESYFQPNLLPDDVPTSTHTIYNSGDIESVSLMDGYVIPLRQRRNGWIYGSLNPKNDVALVKLKQNRYPEKVCQIADALPHNPSPLRKITIYQYPLGHPLQKKSFEFADFSKWTHQCVTLGGSSGSAVRDFDTEQMIGVHQGGNDLHNKFIPFSSPMISLLNMKVYPSTDDLIEKN